jgi:hypothetical protein
MRAFGIVLLILAALVVIPALTYAGYLRLDALRDPAGVKAWLTIVVAGLGACIGGIGVAAVYVGGKNGRPPR